MDPIAFLQKKWQGLVANATSLFWTAVSIVLVAAFLFFFYTPPQSMIGPEQPIPFSHRLHAGHKAIQCQYCHPYVGRSNHPGLPPVEKCLHCHNYIIANHWWIQEEHRYFNTQTPTPWVKANFLAEHVLFNHQRHIRFGVLLHGHAFQHSGVIGAVIFPRGQGDLKHTSVRRQSCGEDSRDGP